MSGPTLSRYTPSLMSHELLERLFVARDRVLDEIMRRIEAAASSSERHHTLLVGPRGAGKTHAVSLVYHRTKTLIDGGRRLQLAWLPEDPWTIVSYRHLLAEIARRLEPAIEDDLPRRVEDLEALLHARAASGGPIVVITENLDVILRAIEDDGQQRLRHLLQSDRSIVLVATTTTLDRALSDQSSPFYGFFTTTRLEPFDVDEAAAMLTAVAEERGDDELVGYLASDEGRARLRTIEHLAGGQPRMWAALASALTVKGLDDLVDLLLTRFDDLTPYYQEQLGRLSGQQRLVVAELAEVDRPITVKELSERLEIDQRSLGKTVSDLVERRWMAETTSPVTAMLDRRRTYYELAEPMARLSFQIKDNRGEPLRVIVDFLKHWFDLPQLEASAGVTAAQYLQAAAAEHLADNSLAVTRLMAGLPVSRPGVPDLLGGVVDAISSLAAGDPEPLLALPVPVRRAAEHDLQSRGVVGSRLVLLREAAGLLEGESVEIPVEPWLRRAEMLARDQPGIVARGVLARWQVLAGRLDEAVATLQAMGVPDAGLSGDWLVTHVAVCLGLHRAGRSAEALAAAEQASAAASQQLGLADVDDLMKVLVMHLLVHSGRSRKAEAIVEAGGVGADACQIRDAETRRLALVEMGRAAFALGRTADAARLLGLVVNLTEELHGDGELAAWARGEFARVSEAVLDA